MGQPITSKEKALIKVLLYMFDKNDLSMIVARKGDVQWDTHKKIIEAFRYVGENEPEFALQYFVYAFENYDEIKEKNRFTPNIKRMIPYAYDIDYTESQIVYRQQEGIIYIMEDENVEENPYDYEDLIWQDPNGESEVQDYGDSDFVSTDEIEFQKSAHADDAVLN